MPERNPWFLFRPFRSPEGVGGGGATTETPGSSSSPGSGSTPSTSAPASTPTPSSPPSGTPSATPSPSPSSTPATPPVPGPASPAATPSGDGDGSFNYDEIFSAVDGSVDPLAPPASVPQEPQPQPTPQPPPVLPAPAPQQAPPPAPGTPPPTEGATSPPGAGQQPASPPLDPSDPFSLARALGEHEQQAVDHIAKEMFSLSPEDMEALEADVAGTVPKLLARSYVKAQHNMLTQLGRLVPQMIERHATLRARNAVNEGKFFGRWPDLKPAEHTDILRQYAVAYRQLHSTATLEQMIEDLGPLVMMAARVSPKSVLPGGQPQVTGVPKPQPFVPAVPGASVVSTSQVEDSPWAILDPSNEVA